MYVHVFCICNLGIPTCQASFLSTFWMKAVWVSSWYCFPFCVTGKTNSSSPPCGPQSSFMQIRLYLAVLKHPVTAALHFYVLWFVFYRNQNALDHCLLHYYIKFIFNLKSKWQSTTTTYPCWKSSTTTKAAGGMSWLKGKQQQQKNPINERKSEKQRTKLRKVL